VENEKELNMMGITWKVRITHSSVFGTLNLTRMQTLSNFNVACIEAVDNAAIVFSCTWQRF